MTAEGPVQIEALVAHDALLRRLAIRMAGESDGDDAAQETWLAALRRGSLRAATANAWLNVVMFRFARSGRRDRARLAEFEAHAARRDIAPSAYEIAERESIRREVVEALLALDPIYRDALLLRYESDLPPRKVAAALGLPVETARTRIKRGLALMRDKLDRKLGPDRRKSFLFLLPFASTRASRVAAALMLAAVGVALVVVARISLIEAPPPRLSAKPPSATSEAPALVAIADRPRAMRPAPISESGIRVLDDRDIGGMFPCAEPRDESGLSRFVATRFVDELSGAPVSGAVAGVADESIGRGTAATTIRSATADHDGWVRLQVEDLRDRSLAIHWSAAGFAPGASSGAVPPFPIRLRKAGAMRLRVVDVTGAPIQGARVEWLIGAARSFGASGTTGVDGWARLAGIDPESGFLGVSRQGFGAEEIALAPVAPGDASREATLLPARVRPAPVAEPASAPTRVQFRCRGSDGRPVAAASFTVSTPEGAAECSLTTDGEGLAEADLRSGSHDVATDDLDAATEVVPDRFVVPASGAGAEVSLRVVSRPRLTIRLPAELAEPRGAILATADAARDVTDDVRTGRAIPVPLAGPVIVAIGSGADRRWQRIADLREPGGAISLSFPQEAASTPPRTPIRTVDVRDGAQKPVAGATLVIEGLQSVLSSRTDLHGQTAFDAASAFSGARVAVRHDGFVPLFAVVDASARTRLSWPDGEVTVVVIGPEGFAGPGPSIIVDGEPLAVEHGVGSIHGLGPGEHVAIVARAGCLARQVTFEVLGGGGGSIRVQLRREP